jgi:catechol 2,3-dioxygenase-like lactoylglutathione lyase family enzyme
MPADDRIRFHLSLNVADLSRSVAFFRALFGIEPAKLRPDYAKFEPDEPPLVLSLEPAAPGSGGPLNHVGLRLPDSKSLVAMQQRLEASGLSSQREDGVECCYAKQTKFWLRDPDGTLWEMYTFDGDIERHGHGEQREVVALQAPTMIEEWEHRIGQPIPARVPLADGVATEVRLRGSFNMPLSQGERATLLSEAIRVLRPGGRLFVHVLTGDQPVANPALGGPASVVRHVPTMPEMLADFEVSGLAGVRLLKYDAKPCFIRNGVPMRETQVEGWRPAMSSAVTVDALYRGPFDQVEVDGRTFRRGDRVEISESLARLLRHPDWSRHFTLFATS